MHQPGFFDVDFEIFRLDLEEVMDRLFLRFDDVLKAQGYLAMGEQIVDGTPVQAWNKWGESPLTPIVYSGV